MANKTATKRRTISKKTATKASLKTASLRNRAVAKVAKKAAKKAPQRESTARRSKGAIWQWSAVETAAAVRTGAISAVEAVEAHLARMRAVNPRLNAVVVDLSEEAMKAARAADKQRAWG